MNLKIESNTQLKLNAFRWMIELHSVSYALIAACCLAMGEKAFQRRTRTLCVLCCMHFSGV